MIDKFHDDYRGFGRLGREGYEITEPDREDYEYVRDVRIFSGVNKKTDGWKIVVDEVPFLFGDEPRGRVPARHHQVPQVRSRGSVDVPRAR